jgi:hypothetical protein
MDTSYPVMVNGEWISWTPLPGLDPSLGREVCLAAATKYVEMKIAGKPEDKCHAAAEQVAFKLQYGVKY